MMILRKPETRKRNCSSWDNVIANATLSKIIKLLCEKVLEDGDIDQCLSCRYEHLFCACSCLFLGLGELGWCNQLEPGNRRALLKSLKMSSCHPLYQDKCEGEVVTSLGEVMAFSWSQHGFPSADQFVKRMLGYKQVTQSSQNKMGKQETELGGTSLAHCAAFLVPASLQTLFPCSPLLFPGYESPQKSSLHPTHAMEKWVSH